MLNKAARSPSDPDHKGFPRNVWMLLYPLTSDWSALKQISPEFFFSNQSKGKVKLEQASSPAPLAELCYLIGWTRMCYVVDQTCWKVLFYFLVCVCIKICPFSFCCFHIHALFTFSFLLICLYPLARTEQSASFSLYIICSVGLTPPPVVLSRVLYISQLAVPSSKWLNLSPSCSSTDLVGWFCADITRCCAYSYYKSPFSQKSVRSVIPSDSFHLPQSRALSWCSM